VPRPSGTHLCSKKPEKAPRSENKGKRSQGRDVRLLMLEGVKSDGCLEKDPEQTSARKKKRRKSMEKWRD